jgi:RHS repeat-associated protein
MPLGYPGQYYDKETGDYYNYFRDYDPGTGRYLQSDPQGQAGGINTYVYTENSPIIYIDPKGLRRGGPITPVPGWNPIEPGGSGVRGGIGHIISKLWPSACGPNAKSDLNEIKNELNRIEDQIKPCEERVVYVHYKVKNYFGYACVDKAILGAYASGVGVANNMSYWLTEEVKIGKSCFCNIDKI